MVLNKQDLPGPRGGTFDGSFALPAASDTPRDGQTPDTSSVLKMEPDGATAEEGKPLAAVGPSNALPVQAAEHLSFSPVGTHSAPVSLETDTFFDLSTARPPPSPSRPPQPLPPRPAASQPLPHPTQAGPPASREGKGMEQVQVVEPPAPSKPQIDPTALEQAAKPTAPEHSEIDVELSKQLRVKKKHGKARSSGSIFCSMILLAMISIAMGSLAWFHMDDGLTMFHISFMCRFYGKCEISIANPSIELPACALVL